MNSKVLYSVQRNLGSWEMVILTAWNMRKFLPFHHIGNYDAAGATLTFYWVDQYTFAIFQRFRYEIVCFFENVVPWVENDLFIGVEPAESQILDPYWLPVVGNLLPSTVYHMGNFVRYNEFEIL